MPNWRSLFIISLMLSLLMIFSVVLAQDDIEANLVGVEVGDWVKYVVRRSGQPTAWSTYDDVEWVKVEVLSISGTNVRARETLHYMDGNEWNSTFSSDVGSDLPWRFIAANLSAGDEIRVDPPLVLFTLNGTERTIEALQINSTVWRSYGGVSREVNLLKWSRLTWYYIYVYNFSEEYCWDRETGFLLEYTFQTYAVDYGNASLSTMSHEITDTNMWKMEAATQPQPIWSQWLLWATVGTVLSAVAVATALRNYKNRGKRT